ncbi:MAG: aminotransferase class III-fold pyridoxal phosphate-dependent enzyme [Rikenellaceae bacterium]|nr:aminotransferase class III-fold pyridoxal phosphate-dependent enzyme [Rikenellaceae bacterium]MCL2692078.1 aminotransferase class III-fold pyridoxal phosphate-dependent enzyme [Rikenellaceae bacterium]
MKPFDVYTLWPVELVHGQGCTVWDAERREYLDFYGGHGVISVGHAHPVYVEAVQRQVAKLGFYSNSVINSLQDELAERLGRVSGYEDYALFLSNSGAEANENALKLASFHTGRRRVLALHGAFHGRTSGAVAATDNPAIASPYNAVHEVTFVPLDDLGSAARELTTQQYAAVIVEGIQGVAGVYEPSSEFLAGVQRAARANGTVFISDEIQSGYGRTGRFFAHQYGGVRPDIITTAKGMGNGFPIGGTLISPEFKPVKGMLGTTFGGNHLACAAACAVLAIIEREGLVAAAATRGERLFAALNGMAACYPDVIADVRGRGLMVGIELTARGIPVRAALLSEERIFTGSSGSNVIRLLPPLTVSDAEVDMFLNKFERLSRRVD